MSDLRDIFTKLESAEAEAKADGVSSEAPTASAGRAAAQATAQDLVVAPLGKVIGTRSGDKGGDANLGVFARTEQSWLWLADWLTVDRLMAVLPEIRDLPVTRYEFPKLRALNFVIGGLLGQGVAASTRQDPQAKALGEWLRARIVEMPMSLLEESGSRL